MFAPLLRWLQDDPRQKLAIFAFGSILFMIGITAIAIAELRLEPSPFARQLAWAGLAGCALGGMTALVGYLGLLTTRLARIFRRR